MQKFHLTRDFDTLNVKRINYIIERYIYIRTIHFKISHVIRRYLAAKTQSRTRGNNFAPPSLLPFLPFRVLSLRHAWCLRIKKRASGEKRGGKRREEGKKGGGRNRKKGRFSFSRRNVLRDAVNSTTSFPREIIILPGAQRGDSCDANASVH